MKDAAQDVAEDVPQDEDVAEDVPQDVAQGVAEDVAKDVPQDVWRRTWPSGLGRRAPSSPRHHRHRRRLCAAHAEAGAQLGSSVAFGSV